MYYDTVVLYSSRDDNSILVVEHCFTNKKGHKHCKGKNHNKPIGKKCHSSDQCMKGNATT